MPLHFMNQVTSLFNPKDRISAETSSMTLPFDVWREVIQQLPLRALLNICLVNKNFYFYAQPFIFEHFVVRPKGQLKTLAASFRKSLAFLQSPRIAWAVRHFHVDLSAFPHTKMVQSASDIVLGEFADCASAFPNLRRFTFVSVYINLPVLSKLQRLLVPFTLALKSCIFASELTKTNLDIPINDLRFTDSSPFIDNFSLHASNRSDCIEGDLFGTLNLLPDTITTLNFVALPLLGPEGLLTQIQGATLKHLGVNCDPHYYVQCLRPDQFVKCLRESRDKIPDTLEELTIGIQIKDPFKCKKKELMVKQEAEILSETSFGTIPSLRTLKVWYWAKPAPRWVTWEKQVNGRIDAFWQRP
ncbi:hypothetical protein AGABI2DRAFT_177018 [Agaricus bisporus var. bisporus H97]|uniref:hypothetical protein n=1 Tax=Agaricus bisporus var. bisporus (strain H97 / ATCC MYA-4626 / FGSC 10389) TaxID=936046 RepID=UPI00029F648B|nr:hypothetical protein AGABI2DRAFT_177018 [Agaricus bisporus var. bisporus H97]EKV50771.1 hypothetical protein AGABI2DRAFT_177018 [Agaricus bisporus var. bisporus H97]